MAEVELEALGLEQESKNKDAKNLSKCNFDPSLSQQRRRELYLEWQKSRRDDLVEKLRKIDSDSFQSESEGEEIDFLEEVTKEKRNFERTNQKKAQHFKNSEKNGSSESNWRDKKTTDQVDSYSSITNKGPGVHVETHEIKIREEPKKFQRAPRKKRQCLYGIMLSEWLVDIPEDFYENWYGVLCPVGKRCLVIAAKGKTKVYTRRNDYLGQFSSELPGGSKMSRNHKFGGVTILDCIWSNDEKIFYILDLITWNSVSMNNCPTVFRQFFLKSRIEENPLLSESNQINAVPFAVLPFFNTEELEYILNSTCPIFSCKIDGVLFYNKEVFYIPEVTPLCLWVHLSDVPKVLSVQVSPELLELERVPDPNVKYYIEKPTYSSNHHEKKSQNPSMELGF